MIPLVFDALSHSQNNIYRAHEEGIMSTFKDRMIRAAKLDVHLYEEVEADTGAMARPWALLYYPA